MICLSPNRDRGDTSHIRSLPDLEKSRTFLSPNSVPARSGNRPGALNCLPHAQTTDQSPDDVFSLLKERAAALMAGKVTEGHSNISLKSTYPAYHLCEDCGPMPQGAIMRGREFAHVHTRYYPDDDPHALAAKAKGETWKEYQGGGQGSMHVCLSNPDAVLAIERGWAEPHLMALMDTPVPKGLILAYAPRTTEEVDVVLSILKASFDFSTSSN